MLLNSESEPYGEVFNVCSGTPVPIRVLLEKLIQLSDENIEIIVDQNKMRPIDVPLYVGSNEKIKTKTGWSPEISLETTLNDSLEYQRDLQGGK
ncbi:GDP-6-deoxy-D-mannose reductase [compost metagenome]